MTDHLDRERLHTELAEALVAADTQDRRLDGHKMDVVHRFADAVLPVVEEHARRQRRNVALRALALIAGRATLGTRATDALRELLDGEAHTVTTDDGDLIRDLAAHGPGQCVTSEDANRVLAQERTTVARLAAALDQLRAFATWLVSLDDDDPESPGRQERRTVTLDTIIEKARAALDGTEAGRG